MSFTTSNDYINQFNENTQKFFGPWSELNKAFVKNAEQMAEFSLNTIRTYTEMGLENMRQISKIDSPEAAKDFGTKQADLLSNISQQILADAQRLTELSSEMQDEVMKVMGDVYGKSNEQMQDAMQKTADQAAKTAQQFTENMSKMAEKATSSTSSNTATPSTTSTSTSSTTPSTSSTTTQTTPSTASTKTSTSTTKI
ncbi:phasin family protein [Psychrobacter sp.]|uniref:phasin family protein n=1 Tax=Psychrobacter sp. TaxID=56811 RepID=UPI0025F30BD3|nr:phasin family protein [Psychrobacter sp.]